MLKNTLDLFDLVLPNFFVFYFILFLEKVFFFEFSKINEVTPKQKEERGICKFIQSEKPHPPTFTGKKTFSKQVHY